MYGCLRFRLLASSLLATLALSVTAAPLRAVITPEARTVVDRYLDATGGRASWEAERSSYARATIKTFGLTGTVESWNARPDRTAQYVQLGPITQRGGTIGARAWRVDQNGKLQWLDGKDLEQARSSAYFENDLWLDPDQGGGSVQRVGPETVGGVQYDVLELTPPLGRPRRYYFDSATGLLGRVTQQQDAFKVAITFSGYEQMAGRLRARDTRQQIEGMPANDVVLHLDSLALNVALDSTVFLPPAPRARDFRFLDNGRLARLPMRYGERHVWVKASVNGGAPEDFILDTGAETSVIDSAYAAKWGLKLEGELQGSGAGATGTVWFSQLQSLRLEGADGQGVEFGNQKIAVIALNRYMAPFFWRDAAGVLGYDFISRFVLTVDYQNQTLTLEDPEGFTYTGKGQVVPMTFSGGTPVVHGSVDGLEGDFRLDVGSGSSVDLHTPFVKKNDLEAKVGKTVASMGGGFGGTFSMLACRAKSFTLGPFTIPDPLASLGQATTGAFASEDYAGNVGNRILDRFVCTFDYNGKKLYLEPDARFAARDESDKVGAMVAKDGERFSVRFVLPGSPAEKAGLRPGDEVRSVAGKPIADYTQDDLRRLVEQSPEGTKLAFEVARDGKAKKIQVKLRAML